MFVLPKHCMIQNDINKILSESFGKIIRGISWTLERNTVTRELNANEEELWILY